jgi:hypothetical protein
MTTKEKFLEMLRQVRAELELAERSALYDEWQTAAQALREAQSRLKEAEFKAGQLRQLYS